ncbi:N-succinylarginine dihydrolase [Chitinibacteraceae bacterium HSL-7]
MNAREANFDGLVGPTHHYGGHSSGNLASTGNAGLCANPQAAALQGLDKMKALADLGYWQGVLPPQERPAMPVLRELGFGGSEADALQAAAAAGVLANVSSASSMWSANAATVSPSADTADGRVHFTPANLVSKFHRAIEHGQTARTLRALFGDAERFMVHDALPGHAAFGDEGAANHTRFAGAYGEAGVEFFVYGQEYWGQGVKPQRFVARQTLEASAAVARRHGLSAARTVFAQQHPDVIDAGVFHNDVIAVGNLDVLFAHERAFLDQAGTYAALDRALGGGLRVVEVPAALVSVEDAVRSYLFNSQLLDDGNGGARLVVPQECRSTPAVWQWLQSRPANSPISDVLVMDLKQSMQNGGGPACLRLRVVLSDAERVAVAPGVWMDDKLYTLLGNWVRRHYRDRMSVADLADPQLLHEVRTALDELTRLLGLGNIYPFQSG